MTVEIESLRAMLAQQRQRVRESIRSFERAALAGDVGKLSEACRQLSSVGGWTRAARLAARWDWVPPSTQAYFREAWVEAGDSIRDEVNHDRSLLGALRRLLPAYEGSGLTLYRGDSAFNRRRRTYGMSWSADPVVAEEFARGWWQTFQGGSVLLETFAPAEAILAVMHEAEDDRYGEREYLVDRRRLGAVKVVARYEQRPMPMLSREGA